MRQIPTETQLKSEMLCRGVALGEELPLLEQLHSRNEFIHGTVFLLEGGGIVNTAVWSQEQAEAVSERCRARVPTLTSHGDQLIIAGQAGETTCNLLSLGDTSELVVQNSKASDWFSLHNNSTLFCAPVRQCMFIAIGRPCRFCTFEGGRVERLTPEEFERGLKVLIDSRPMISSVAIGGGTPEFSDMGAEYFASLAQKATAMKVSSSVEMVPPPKSGCLEGLKRAGLSSLIMSLEIWDEERRAEWCLGKGDVSRSQYFERWREAIDVFGCGNVSSVFLVGAEPIVNTLEGAKYLIELGVIPTLIPLRWYPNSRFQLSGWSPVDPADYLSLGYQVSHLLTSAGLTASKQLGCTSCGGCSLETAIEKLDVARIREE
jgi:hypothetical protein